MSGLTEAQRSANAVAARMLRQAEVERSMKLRDEFAKAALTGLCAGAKFGDSHVFDDAATRAYAFADAMLEARNANL